MRFVILFSNKDESMLVEICFVSLSTFIQVEPHFIKDI